MPSVSSDTVPGFVHPRPEVSAAIGAMEAIVLCCYITARDHETHFVDIIGSRKGSAVFNVRPIAYLDFIA